MPDLPYPTLSEVGLVYDPHQKIEWIFADYCAAKFSQSDINHGKISSLSYDEFDGNYEGVRTAEVIRTSLERLYSAYFTTADFQVTDNSAEDSHIVNVIIKGAVVQGGKTYQINESLSINNDKINRLSKFN